MNNSVGGVLGIKRLREPVCNVDVLKRRPASARLMRLYFLDISITQLGLAGLHFHRAGPQSKPDPPVS